ncbi:hypothetical protein J6590_060095 [Homalodisca vitripennis]|nr:hypothetical protein J6590_060095 [Homalodisca vitripennis]
MIVECNSLTQSIVSVKGWMGHEWGRLAHSPPNCLQLEFHSPPLLPTQKVRNRLFCHQCSRLAVLSLRNRSHGNPQWAPVNNPQWAPVNNLQ